MLTRSDLEQAIEAYSSNTVSLDQFADWYDNASRGKFGASKDVLSLCLEIDLALSNLQFEGISEGQFREELATVVRPFAPAYIRRSTP